MHLMMVSKAETFSGKEAAHRRQEVKCKVNHEKDVLSQQVGSNKVVEKLACLLTF
jgi:hypothetical protein